MQIEEIIQGCRKSDRKCQEALYNVTSGEIMNICYRYLSSKDDAKDVLQNVYIIVFRKMHLFDEKKGSIGAWMAKIAVNECLKKLQKGKKLNFSSLEVCERVEDNNFNIYSSIAAQDILLQVNKLSDGYRMIFNLFVVEGFNHVEIGEMLSISPSTSRSQLARAKQKLKSLLEKNLNMNYYAGFKR